MTRTSIIRALAVIACFTACLPALGQKQWQPIQTPKGHSSPITFLYFYQQYLFSGDKNGVVKVWETSPSGAKLLQSIKAHNKEVSHIEMDKDGKNFLTAGYDGAINIFKLKGLNKEASWALEGTGAYEGIGGMEATFANYSPDLQHIYAGGYNQKVQKIDASTGKSTTLYTDADGYGLTCGEIIPGRNWLAFGMGGIIRFIDIRTEKMLPMAIGRHGKYEDYVCEIGYFPGKSWLTAWLVSGAVKVYDLNNGGQLIQTIQASTKQGSVRSGHAGRAGILATGNAPKISLFDIGTGAKKAVLSKHKSPVSCLAFNDAETLLASGSEGSEIVIWAEREAVKEVEYPWMREENMIAGRSFIMENLKFDRSSYVLRKEGKEELDNVIKWMKRFPSIRISLEGHTSNEGEYGANQVLSERRVIAAKNYLADAGIAEDRIETIGFGEDKPIADNATAKGREQNRRLEMRIIEM